MIRLLFAFFFAASLAGCTIPCRNSADCDKGWRCDITEKHCVQGCTEESTCTNGCNLETGLCRPPSSARFTGPSGVDSGTGTSSTADAAVVDAT